MDDSAEMGEEGRRKRQEAEEEGRGDSLGEDEEERLEDDDDDEGRGEEAEEDEEDEGEERASRLGESNRPESGTPAPMEAESDRHAGPPENSGPGTKEEAEAKEILRNETVAEAEAEAKTPTSSSVCPTSLPDLSPRSLTQSITSTSTPMLPEKKSSFLNTDKVLKQKSDKNGSAEIKALTVRTTVPDGYNWRKYGQKQVKSPKGSRSYYRCTYADCCAKKIECSDDSGHVIEIVKKGMHSHDPPRKNSSFRESRIALSPAPSTSGSSAKKAAETPVPDPPSSLKEPLLGKTTVPERKRQNSSSSGSGDNRDIQIKEDDSVGPEPKRRLKKGSLPSLDPVVKSGKKPKFVVHAAGDVGIASDGYRWRKYGQKMVKGNPHPRNYYRCTSAGCPVRKHIETAVDNSNAVIITYKGVHDHDMPVPKKRHGPRSASLVAAAAPASMNSVQHKKTDTQEVTSTQWSLGKEGEITSESLDVKGEKDKTIESARTLLSIGFEIKQC